MRITHVAGEVVSGVATTAWRGAAGVAGLAGQGLRTASRVTGAAWEVAETAARSSRGTRQDPSTVTVPDPASDEASDTASDEASTVAKEHEQAPADPRDDLPGPDVVAPAVPRPGDLPEPVVIEPAAEGVGEFHTEPKPVSRDSARGGTTTDPEDVSGYDEEVVHTEDDTEVTNPAGTPGAGVADNPATVESDLHQPGTPPLADPALAKALRSESETLRRAAHRDPGHTTD